MPVEYFHVVFTLPAAAAAIAYHNKAVLYAMLFEAAAETLKTIAADKRHLGAEIGATMVLHTWGQTLTHHPHVHCIVPGGGVSPGGDRWIACRQGFFLPVRVLSRLYRRLFLEKLTAAHRAGRLKFFGDLKHLADRSAFDAALGPLRRTNWLVYAKRPFAGPEQVLAYLARYTHRVAISNHRLLAIDDDRITFSWRDYRNAARTKPMTLEAREFTLNEYARDNDPFAKVGRETVSVEVSSVVRASESSFQMRWLERTFEGGALKDTRRLTGLFSLVLTPPRTVDAVRKNPLGIYVHTFNWSQDVTPSTGVGK